VEALARLADEARDADEALTRMALHALDRARERAVGADEIRLETASLRAYHTVIRRYALRIAYERLRGTRMDLTRDHLRSLERLLSRSGEVCLPGGIRAVGEHGRLRLRSSGADPAVPSEREPIEVRAGDQMDLSWAGWCLTTCLVDRSAVGEVPSDERREVVFDFDELTPPLFVRGWRPGDAFIPLGMTGHQKLSDLFGNRRVPRSERPRIPILEDAVGILWVVGYRRSERGKVTDRTRRVLRARVDEP
jgi:tRNA(Ile)-lysidine synthase